MKIFIVRDWRPFPDSEYGGRYTVIAENEKQAVQILKQASNHDYLKYSVKMIQNVVKLAKRFDLEGTPEAGIVDSFRT